MTVISNQDDLAIGVLPFCLKECALFELYLLLCQFTVQNAEFFIHSGASVCKFSV